jgi:hypothetical protein
MVFQCEHRSKYLAEMLRTSRGHMIQAQSTASAKANCGGGIYISNKFLCPSSPGHGQASVFRDLCYFRASEMSLALDHPWLKFHTSDIATIT